MHHARILYKSFYWKALQFLVSILVNILFVRLLQPVITAEFYSLLYLLSISVVFFSFGFDIGINFFLAKKEISPEAVNTIIVGIVLVALCISLPILYLIYQPAIYTTISPKNFIFLSALYISGNLLSLLCGTIFTANGKNYLPSIVSFIAGCIMLIGITIIQKLLAHREAINTIFPVYFLLYFLQGLVLFVYSSYTFCKKNWFKYETITKLKSILKFSLFAFIINFMFFLATKLCILMMPYWIDAGKIGNFIVAFKIVEYFQTVVSFLYYPFIAIVALNDSKKIELTVLMLVRFSNTFILVFCLFIIFTGKFLLPFLFGKSFNEIYYIFIWLIPGLFTASISTFYTAYYFGTGYLKYNFRSALIQAISTFGFFLLFIKLLGVYGTALSFSLASTMSLLYDALIFKKFLKYKIHDILFVNRSDIPHLYSVLKRRTKQVAVPKMDV